MKKALFLYFIFLVGVVLSADDPGNCSTFMLKHNSILMVGHNLDESPYLHIPGLICINKRNVYREGMTWYELIADPPEYKKAIIPFEKKPSPKIRWRSKYGSVTFNSEGIDFPDGGVNEKGLALFEMSMGKTKHKVDPANPTLFICLWIQYQLDNCATVDEVIQNAHTINQQGWAWHYFVSDREGSCAVIEYIDGKVVVYKGEAVTYPVLCNTQYSRELWRVKLFKGFGGTMEIKPFLGRFPPRFVRAARMLQAFDPVKHRPAHDYALSILKEIWVPNRNKWSILVDVNNSKVYFHTNKNRNLRYFSYTHEDFLPDKPCRILNIHTPLSGDVSASFVNYSYQRNLILTRVRAKYLFMKRFTGLIDNGVTAEVYAKRFADYSQRIRNKK